MRQNVNMANSGFQQQVTPQPKTGREQPEPDQELEEICAAAFAEIQRQANDGAEDIGPKWGGQKYTSVWPYTGGIDLRALVEVIVREARRKRA